MQPFAANPELARQTEVSPAPQIRSFGEAYSSSLRLTLNARSTFMESNAVNDVLSPIIEELNEGGENLSNWPGNHLVNPGSAATLDPFNGWKFKQFGIGPINAAIARRRARDPDYNVDAIDIATLQTQVRDRIVESEAEVQLLQQRTQTGMGQTGSMVGSLAAFGSDFVQALSANPEALFAVFFGGSAQAYASTTASREIGRRMLVEGVIGAGVEAYLQSGVAAYREKYGLEYDFADFALAVGLGAGGGAAFGAGLQGIALATKYKQRAVGREMLRSVNRATVQQIDDAINALERPAVMEGLRALEKAGVPLPAGASRLLDLFDQGKEIATENPLAGKTADADHLANTGAAATILDTADLPVAVPQRATVKAPADIHTSDNLDATVFRFRPSEIEVDAEMFQFKAGGDAFGVTDRLAGVTQWDAIKAGQIVVYEAADGRRVIADGHQRLGLARRIAAQDPTQDPVIYGTLLREVDGITPDQARVVAALKNIAEGTGSAVDAAKVLRISPEMAASLPPRSNLVRQARELVNLSEDSFALVSNGVVPANYAAVVGRLISDKDQQMAVMNLLARIKPDNMTQAESIVRQARDQGFDTGEQTDMLGTLVVAESLFLERAKVLDAAGKALRRDRAVFNSLIDNQARIEAEGNVLSTAANQTKERVDAQAIEIIQKVANRKGSVSDSLTQAARQLKEGDAAGATKAFVSAIRDAIQRGDFDGVDVGAEGRAFDAPPETSRLAAGPSRDTLDAFDDPAVGAARQADQLEVDEFGATVRETAQPDVELREDLRRIVDAGAKPDEIDAHPAITEALARAMALDETHLDARYGTPAWTDTRSFVFGDAIIFGYEQGVERLYQDARKLAWADEGLPPQPVQQGRRATIVLGAPASGKSAFSNRIAQQRGAALIDPDEAKKVLTEYENGVGAHAVHKESTDLARLMLQRAVANGDNVVLPRTGSNPKTVQDALTGLKEMGYEVDLVLVRVPGDEAYRRNIRRFIDTGRLVPPAYVRNVVGDNPTSTYNTFKSKANRHAEIDNSGPQSSPKPVSDTSADNPLEGIDLRLRDTTSGSGRSVREVGATEQTAQGEQRLVPGVAPVTQAERLTNQADQPLAGGDAPADFGLFDTGARQQTDLLDLVPAGREVDGQAQFQTRAQALAEIQQDKAMLKRFEECVT